jgi:stringent starvation protein B
MASEQKRAKLIEMLGQGMVMIHLDARRPGVVVPRAHAGDRHLRLNLSHAFSIPDFVVGEHLVSATLSFGGVPFHCEVPYEAVFAMSSHVVDKGYVWPADMPADIALDAPEEAGAAKEPPEEAGPRCRGRRLRVVK